MLRMAVLLSSAAALAAQEPPETGKPEIPVLPSKHRHHRHACRAATGAPQCRGFFAARCSRVTTRCFTSSPPASTPGSTKAAANPSKCAALASTSTTAGVNGGLKSAGGTTSQQNQNHAGPRTGLSRLAQIAQPRVGRRGYRHQRPVQRGVWGFQAGSGVVHIRLRESLPDQWTARIQGGSFDTRRAFLSFSPEITAGGAFVAYEGSRTNGPFQEPLRYARDNVTANWDEAAECRAQHRAQVSTAGAIASTPRARSRSTRWMLGVSHLSATSTRPMEAAGSPVPWADTTGRNCRAAPCYVPTPLPAAPCSISSRIFTFLLNNPDTGDAFPAARFAPPGGAPTCSTPGRRSLALLPAC